MPLCVYAQENPLGDIIAIEGEFIRSFIKDAPADYIKVYLYCQYLAGHQDENCSGYKDIAAAVGVTVDEVKAALDFWAAEYLLSVASEHPLLIQVRGVKEAALLKAAELPVNLSLYNDYFASVRALLGGRELKPAELEKARDWVEVYNLPPEVVILLIQHCLGNLMKEGKSSRNPFNYIDKVAYSWAQNNLLTVEAAERYLTIYELEHHQVNEVMLHLGIKRMPSIEEVKLYDKWTKEWNIAHEAVIEACAETTKTSNPSFAYLDKIIQKLYFKGATGADEVRQQLDESNAQRQQAGEILNEMGLKTEITPEFLEMLKACRGQGFTQDGLVYIAKELGKKPYKSLDKYFEEVDKWAARNAFDKAQMEMYEQQQRRYDNEIAQLLVSLGLKRGITEHDREDYISWKEEHKYSDELIAAAAAEAKHSYYKMKRMSELLQSWAGQNITDPRQIKSAVKQTAAHQYDARGTENLKDIYTDIDKLGDVL